MGDIDLHRSRKFPGPQCFLFSVNLIISVPEAEALRLEGKPKTGDPHEDYL